MDSLDDGKDGGPDTVCSIQQSGITFNKLRYCWPFLSLFHALEASLLWYPSFHLSILTEGANTHRRCGELQSVYMCRTHLLTIPYACRFGRFFSQRNL